MLDLLQHGAIGLISTSSLLVSRWPDLNRRPDPHKGPAIPDYATAASWTRRDSNPRHPARKAGSLPLTYGPEVDLDFEHDFDVDFDVDFDLDFFSSFPNRASHSNSARPFFNMSLWPRNMSTEHITGSPLLSASSRRAFSQPRRSQGTLQS